MTLAKCQDSFEPVGYGQDASQLHTQSSQCGDVLFQYVENSLPLCLLVRVSHHDQRI